jgi:hypothetical protein
VATAKAPLSVRRPAAGCEDDGQLLCKSVESCTRWCRHAYLAEKLWLKVPFAMKEKQCSLIEKVRLIRQANRAWPRFHHPEPELLESKVYH